MRVFDEERLSKGKRMGEGRLREAMEVREVSASVNSDWKPPE